MVEAYPVIGFLKYHGGGVNFYCESLVASHEIKPASGSWVPANIIVGANPISPFFLFFFFLLPFPRHGWLFRYFFHEVGLVELLIVIKAYPVIWLLKGVTSHGARVRSFKGGHESWVHLSFTTLRGGGMGFRLSIWGYESRAHLLYLFSAPSPCHDWLFRYFYCEGGLFEPSIVVRRIRYLVFQVLLLRGRVI